MKKSDTLSFELSNKETIFIFIYYFIVLVVGSIFSIKILISLDKDLTQKQIIIKTIISSLSVSGMLCSLQYIKRLYKACITNRIVPKATSIGHIGNFAYFVFRPFYAFVFVIVMIYSILSGLFVVTGSLDYIINEKFLYLCVILSSFIGFSVGQVLDKFEDISKQKIDRLD